MSRKWAIIIIAGASVLTRFIFFGYPDQTVFDEVHFGKFIAGYYTNEYFFDIHPPLGKLLIAGFGKIFDFNPEFSFAKIGEKFPDRKYLALRFLPSLAGAMLPFIIYLLALELGYKRFFAFGAGMLVVLENSIAVQSRFILLDSILLLFGFSALFFYFLYRNRRNCIHLLFMSLCGGLALSVKWTGLGFLALAGTVEFIDLFQSKKWTLELGKIFIFFALIPAVLYFLVFSIHFTLLTKSGPGDAFMTSRFQKTLAENQYESRVDVKPLNLFQKFVELNKQMYTSNQGLTADHPYGSSWYTWPLMARPIYYWVDTSSASNTARIYLFGNPAVWWLSSMAVIFLALETIVSRRLPGKLVSILFAGYIINLLPFIGVKRVMFLYHYMTALVIAILFLVYVIENFSPSPRKTILGVLGLAAALFLFFSPLTYGTMLSDDAYRTRLWLKSWE
jgi:dolichyl-phosphate-mannose-protein mannosyltransferase